MYRMTVQSKAHALTLLAVLWTPFALFGVYDYVDCRRWLTFDVNSAPDYVVWTLYALFIAGAAHFFRKETAQPVLCIDQAEIQNIGRHIFIGAALANIPVFAVLQSSLACHIAIHILLIAISGVGYSFARKQKRRQSSKH
ncbi:hypothetical protein CCAX7_19070 [Capsulimonas corticalis]|uniref:Uncharacterized protein n=1 Tax=Capsulimonas corticalis TaxID=2219043 RepID=A0A402D5C2_9BACT|nr:hypothetical protein [Capsulimonas corticalis]BDI29856.1 hypothetical protein CCAX7_19070 [Capsulimonas corticalis]